MVRTRFLLYIFMYMLAQQREMWSMTTFINLAQMMFNTYIQKPQILLTPHPSNLNGKIKTKYLIAVMDKIQ